MPMTISRIVSPDVKWRSTWRVSGTASPWCDDDENPAAEGQMKRHHADVCRQPQAGISD